MTRGLKALQAYGEMKMAIAATEHCNPCDNADFEDKPHRHFAPDMCMRPMYKGDFFCACTEKNVIKPKTPAKGR